MKLKLISLYQMRKTGIKIRNIKILIIAIKHFILRESRIFRNYSKFNNLVHRIDRNLSKLRGNLPFGL